MDLKLKDRDFWYSLHRQVPGLLDWDMENELFLPCTTDQSNSAEENLVRYKIRVVKPPVVPEERKFSPDEDGPHIEPNLWMWVNPNSVCPLNSQESPKPSNNKKLTSMLSIPQPTTSAKESDCSEAQEVVEESLLFSSSEQSPQQMQFTSSPRESELTEEKAEAEKDNSVVLPLPTKRDYFQKQKQRQANKLENKSWPRPPLNYSHLIALALKNSPPCGLNVQQIYNFTQQHFPFYWTAPEGWKNTIRHNLCFLGSFEKVPLTPEDEAELKPRSCLWRLTEEGHRRFQEDIRVLASVCKESIQQSMSQPDLMASLFHF
ncbi:forkhead box protein R2 [Castor canadensis]|uniref:Forkhead box protein R2 n=1 Tax=Castor canadensis TaxID=51338 RepID=A0A8B7TK71_CASCN|nr:forkhead box protein R2 [Castor canadensis]